MHALPQLAGFQLGQIVPGNAQGNLNALVIELTAGRLLQFGFAFWLQRALAEFVTVGLDSAKEFFFFLVQEFGYPRFLGHWVQSRDFAVYALPWLYSRIRIEESSQYNQNLQTMTKATFTLRLPHSLKCEAIRFAKQQGVSLNHWIVAAVAEKIAAMNAAASNANTAG
jgi:HicB family